MYEQVTHLQPGWGEAWYGLGLAESNAGELRKAEDALTKSLTLNPNNLKSAVLLAEVIYREGAWEHARNQARLAIDLAKSWEKSHEIDLMLPWSAAYTVDRDEFLQIKRDAGKAWQVYGLALVEIGRIQQDNPDTVQKLAINALEKAKQLAPDDATSYYNLSVAYVSIPDYDDALVAVNNAFKHLGPEPNPMETGNIASWIAYKLLSIQCHYNRGIILAGLAQSSYVVQQDRAARQIQQATDEMAAMRREIRQLNYPEERVDQKVRENLNQSVASLQQYIEKVKKDKNVSGQ